MIIVILIRTNNLFVVSTNSIINTKACKCIAKYPRNEILISLKMAIEEWDLMIEREGKCQMGIEIHEETLSQTGEKNETERDKGISLSCSLYYMQQWVWYVK